MSGILDMSLDDYLSTTSKTKNRRMISRRGARAQATQMVNSSNRLVRTRNAPYDRSRPSRGDINSQWSHDLFEDDNSHDSGTISRPSTPYSNTNNKLLVENLFYEVTQDDLQNLFSKIGIVKKVRLHYDRAGRSLGVADVVFENSADASEAMRKYNGKTLEGQEMRIKSTPSRSSQKAPNNRTLSSTIDSGSVFDRVGGTRISGTIKNAARGSLQSRLGRGGKIDEGSNTAGRNINQPDNRRKSSQRKLVTYDDLNADLDAYMSTETTMVEQLSTIAPNGDNAMDLS